jgi:hypothetical protein
MVAQRGERRLTEHAAVGDHDRAPDPEALPEAGDGQAERVDISGVAGQDVERHRPALTVHRHAQHQLRQVRSTIAAVAVPDQCALTLAIEIDRGGVDEHQVERGREQVPVLEEELLLERVPDRRQPWQRAVEVLQGQVVEALRLDRRCPGGTLQIRARGAQPLQGEREGHPLGVEAEPAAFGMAVEDLGQTLLLPQPAKDQRRTPAPGPAGDQPLVLGRVDDLEPGAEAGQRLDQLVELAGGDEQIAAAEAGHQLLAHSRAVAHRAHDLQVLVALATPYDRFDPYEHRSSHASLPRRRQDLSS